jgi:hypothetical protein
MKKFFWIAALFAVLALIFAGCPTGGGTDPNPPPPDGGDGEFEYWLASSEDGTKINGDTVTLTGTGEEIYVYVFFTPPGVSFEKLKIDYTYGEAGTGFDMRWQCAYDASGTWGSVSGDPNYIGWQEKGPSECAPATLFTQKWGSGHIGNAVDLTTIKGICFAVTVGVGTEAKFKLLSVELVGLDYKALLNKSITDADALVESEYTPASWTALQTALTAAKAVAAKTNATTAEINSARTSLDAAIKALVPAGAVDKTALNALIATAETKVEADYTPGSWTAFSEALTKAKEASASASMGQTAINSEKDALQAAMDALALRIYVSNFIYTGTNTAAETSTIEIDTVKTSPGVTVSSGSIKVPRDNAADGGKGETRLNLTISPPINITSYGEIAFEWSGHANASFNISLIMSGNRMLSKDASGTSTTFDFVTDVPSWATGWGDAAIGSLSGIEVYSASTAISELTISKITIAGDPVEIGGGDDGEDGEPVEATNWYLTDTENGAAVAGNSVTGTDPGGENAGWYVYIYFDPNTALKDVILTYTVTGSTITKQCVYDATGTWGWGWGNIASSGSKFDLSGAGSWGASGTSLDKATLKGICLKMIGNGTFTLTKVDVVPKK